MNNDNNDKLNIIMFHGSIISKIFFFAYAMNGTQND